MRKDLTDAVHNLYVTVIGSVDLRQESRALFQVEDLLPAQISIASSICLELFEKFVHEVSIAIAREHATTEVNFNVPDMPKEGLAKLRHVGGWAVRKELERARRYMRANMFSLSSETRQNLNAAHARCSLLEDHVIVQYDWIKDNTTSPETLEVTENRQFRERGLLHISDPAYTFILKLETLRVELLNTHRIRHYEAKSEFVDNALKSVLKNQEVKSAWDAVFHDAHPDKKRTNYLMQLLQGTCGWPLHSSSRIFGELTNSRKPPSTEKGSCKRQQVATVRKDAIPFERIVRDNSPGKQSSHRSLRVFVEKHGASGLEKIYKKDQLVKLCRGYGVVVRSTHNKIQLSNLLLEALNACPEERIPYPFSLGNLESTTETNSGRLILRIRRV
ncbi:hypothetical protein OS493_036552 [Desmophyllum pertusum]|uniref:Uncharacterized protein n=1 Tax=Desmophyllum pertusum TaxID=174260 RepID=A0A9W9YUM3_9CNID|nr:hypothetical protein OS493_036552 [Desmophyllum pertusum]